MIPDCLFGCHCSVACPEGGIIGCDCSCSSVGRTLAVQVGRALSKLDALRPGFDSRRLHFKDFSSLKDDLKRFLRASKRRHQCVSVTCGSVACGDSSEGRTPAMHISKVGDPGSTPDDCMLMTFGCAFYRLLAALFIVQR
jgi:hypothetical protein